MHACMHAYIHIYIHVYMEISYQRLHQYKLQLLNYRFDYKSTHNFVHIELGY